MSTHARAAANRQNAQLSTGPRTEAGKKRSSQNAFRHGFYSKQLLLPHEDPEELNQLRAALFEEHQPASATEHILVEEIVQSAWRIRRYRQFEDDGFQPDNIEAWLSSGLFAVLQRALAAAERAFHRALAALTKLQRARGFVPAETHEEHASAETSVTQPVGVGQNSISCDGFQPSPSMESPKTSAQPPSRMT